MTRRQGVLRFRSILIIFLVIFSTAGCEAFVRKFTRKPKSETRTEEQVIEPQAYPDILASGDQVYKDYFLFWESWADELYSFLGEGANRKKQKECAEEALHNLVNMQSLLNKEKAGNLGIFIAEFTLVKTRNFEEGYLNSFDLSYLRNRVRRIKSGVHRGFIFSRVKSELKQ